MVETLLTTRVKKGQVRSPTVVVLSTLVRGRKFRQRYDPVTDASFTLTDEGRLIKISLSVPLPTFPLRYPINENKVE